MYRGILRRLKPRLIILIRIAAGKKRKCHKPLQKRWGLINQHLPLTLDSQ